MRDAAMPDADAFDPQSIGQTRLPPPPLSPAELDALLHEANNDMMEWQINGERWRLRAETARWTAPAAVLGALVGYVVSDGLMGYWLANSIGVLLGGAVGGVVGWIAAQTPRRRTPAAPPADMHHLPPSQWDL